MLNLEEKYYDTSVLTIILESVFEKSSEQIRKSIENEKITITDDEIKNFLDDNANSNKYNYEPYTLKYFKTYTDILREKVASLLYVIENLDKKEIDLIKETLIDLDINLDENNNISKSDIVRLLKPTIFNINTLKANVRKANDVKTYLDFSISLDSIYRDGFTEPEIYPNKSLQIKNLYYNHTPGNVDLSENQVAELTEENKKSMVYFLNMMNNK